MRRVVCLVLLGVAFVSGIAASAADRGRIEVVDVSGIIDANVERAITRGITGAEREHAKLVVLELNSNGTIGAGRAERIASRIERSRVPVAAWIGPAGAKARNGADVLWWAAHFSAIAPAASVGPVETLDLRSRPGKAELRDALRRLNTIALGPLTADQAKDLKYAHYVVGSVGDLVSKLDGYNAKSAQFDVTLDIDPRRDVIRLHKLDLIGRMLHAAAQPSIVYLLALLGLVGIVFEVFHPSTGPAGVTGAVAMGLAIYGMVALGGSWLGFALIVAGVVGFAVDLRYQSLGAFTIAGFAGLAAGSALLFNGPYLRVPPWLIAGGVVGMTAFLLGAMTRVLRDLRLVASGQLEVRDAHDAILDDGHGGTNGR